MAPAKRGRGRPKKPVADLAESTRRRRMGEGRFLEGRDEIAYGIFDGDGKPGVGGGGIAAGPGAGGGGLEVGVADDLKMLRGLLGGGASANAEASGSGSNGAQVCNVSLLVRSHISSLVAQASLTSVRSFFLSFPFNRANSNSHLTP